MSEVVQSSQVGRSLDEIRTPAFLVNRKKVEANCKKIRQICETNGVSLRAQTKTHKTIEILDLQTNGTRRGLVCSTLEECQFYANQGCDDIIFGFPIQENQFEDVFKFTSLLDEFHVFTDSVAIATQLCKLEPPKGKKWSLFIKVDCGGNRAGIWWEDIEKGKTLASVLKESTTAVLKGVYVHCGNTYLEATSEDVKQTRNDTIESLVYFVDNLRSAGHEIQTVGIGSTPSCSHDSSLFSKLTELHPGNYVFYDFMQAELGSCTYDDIAGCVATRIIGHYPRRKQFLVDCGFTALTKQGPKNKEYPFAVFVNEPNLRLSAMTQEIGFVEACTGVMDFEKYPVGTMLFLFPYHSCATSNQYSTYLVIENGRVVAEWKTVNRR